jgi:putative transposase
MPCSPSMPVAPSKIMPDNNIVEQDHRAIKRIIRPMLGFKSMHCARILLAGIETMHMIRKGQLGGPKRKVASAAKQFYSLAF